MLACMARHDFPITELLPQILASLAQHPRLVLEAPPGAGKTTQVPLALLDAPWLLGRRIIVLEPRRVAARAAAGFMAQQLGERVGETVGYRIRADSQISARTRIEVVTEGILTRMLQDDPMLGEGTPGNDRSTAIGALLFDEFHERHLSADIGLALALDVQQSLRPDLRIVLMSATLDGERIARWLDAPRLSSAGRSYPVDIAHFPARRAEALESQARRAVEHALAAHAGDVLVFLPGQREIARVQQALSAITDTTAVDVLALHGELPVEQQARVLQPGPAERRRVVLATNVAESSVTLPGVRVVIDSGLAREPRYDPNSGFSRLDVVAIAQSSADQRAGRAGRVAAGWAYRLWPQSQRLEPQRRPEIAQVELAGLALELAAWGSEAVRFLDAPPTGATAAGRDILQRLGAVDVTAAITPLGRRMLALGTHPRLAALLLAPVDGREQALACDLAALLEARDPLPASVRSDALVARWNALAAWRSGRTALAHRGSLAVIDAAARQWRRRLDVRQSPPQQVSAHEIGDIVLRAFPDRIARQRPDDPLRYQLANGRMARLLDDSTLYGEPWIVASELRLDTRDALLLRGAPLDEARLARAFPERFVEQDSVRWDATQRALVAQREQRFDAIVLDVRPAGRIDPALAARALTDAVRTLGLGALPWSDALVQWRARVRALRTWMPELAGTLPDLDDTALLATLDAWLQPAFVGKTRLDGLDSGELAQALMAQVDGVLRRRVEQLAPVRITVPSGMERALHYAIADDGQPIAPVLAVKLQELFGLAETPRIAEGRVPVMLHLLSPAGRPLQVTQDLRGFWERTWPEVRREMKGRYPRHPWPDDPWTAPATHRAKPRAR
ncbi:MAG: hrpB [Xanthomonadaceae bacterium]|nr:hrpB [Xanthomonadaceae bacterium]